MILRMDNQEIIVINFFLKEVEKQNVKVQKDHELVLGPLN